MQEWRNTFAANFIKEFDKMTRNQYIKDNGYIAWLGRESLNKEVKCLLDSFQLNATNKQINRFSEMIERHIKRDNNEKTT